MPTTYNSDGSQADVASKITSAISGDTITIPSGSFTWTSGIVIPNTKGIKITGAGAGRVLARSASSVACGTGTKVFTLNASGIAGITNGATLRIERTGTSVSGGNATGTRTWMEGTVTSYSGTTLTMNITSSANAVTQAVWIVVSPATTTITNNAGSSYLIDIAENTSASTEVSGLRIVAGTGTNYYMRLSASSSSQPALIHDCFFESNASSGGIRIETNKGIIWNSSFVAYPFSMGVLGIEFKTSALTNDWTTASTMGTADTTGKSNVYVEDCDFHGWLNASDSDDNSRTVMRYNLLNNAAHGSHGADTSTYGVRHYEFYNETFVFNGFSDGQTFNMNWFFYLRGGTGIITDCVIPDITSSDYGNKGEVTINVQNLQRNSGPNPLWGDGIAGVQYPCPRQFGFGRVTGAAGNDSVTYIGDSEPFYQWNNTGTGAYASPSILNYATPTGTQDSIVDYVQVGRDYINSAKSGYTKYTYPHPLRTDLGVSTPVLTSAIVAAAGTTIALTFSESCTTGAGGPTGFTLSASGGAVTMTYASGTGSTAYTYTLSRTIVQGETITMSFTQPVNGVESTAAQVDLASFSGTTVTNSSTYQVTATTNATLHGRRSRWFATRTHI